MPGCFLENITNIEIIAPVGSNTSSLLLKSYDAKKWYKILSWESAAIGTYLICSKAYDTTMLISQSTCYTVLVGTPIPTINQTSVYPTGLVFPTYNSFIFYCEYEANVTKPTVDAYINVYLVNDNSTSNNTNDTLVYKINSASSGTTYFFNSTWMSFSIPLGTLPSGYYYFTFDYGVALGTVLCKPISPAIIDPTFWTFQINNTGYTTTTTTTKTTTLATSPKTTTIYNGTLSSSLNFKCNTSNFMLMMFLLLVPNATVHYTLFIGIFIYRESFFKFLYSSSGWSCNAFKRSKVLFKRVSVKSKNKS
jgi:hypothetical protein